MSLMLKEILEAPNAVKRAKETNKAVISHIASEWKQKNLFNMTTVARGTSKSAATYFKYVSEIQAGIPVNKYLPSVTTVYNEYPLLRDHMLLAISQSGQSTDTMLALNAAKAQGALTVSVTNDEASPLAKNADYHIFLDAGEERSVSATKSFLSQLTVLTLLADALSVRSDSFDAMGASNLIQSFFDEKNESVCGVAERCAKLDNAIVLSRGMMQGIANELSLKLMETSYVLSRSFSTSDFMHGPIAVVSEGTYVLLLAPSGPMEAEFKDIAMRLKLLGANLIAFTDIKAIQSVASDFIAMPNAEPKTQPLLYAAAVQLFSEKLSNAKGFNPDVPRNLKKVTITK